MALTLTNVGPASPNSAARREKESVSSTLNLC